jgi:hypothetical protein
MYPLFYWMVMLVVTVTATPAALLRPGGRTSHWRTARVSPDEDAVALEPVASTAR